MTNAPTELATELPELPNMAAGRVLSAELPTTVRRRFLAHWLMLAVALLTLGGFIANILYEEKQKSESSARERLSLVAESAAMQIERRLISIDSALRDLRQNLPHLRTVTDAEAALAMYLGAFRNAVDGVDSASIADATGRITLSSRPTMIGEQFGRNQLFPKLNGMPDEHVLYVSEPFATRDGRYSLNLSHAVFDAHGEFSGSVIVTIAPGDFAAALASLRYTPDVSVGLIHGSGKVLLYLATPDIAPGTDVSGARSFFGRHRQSGKTHNVFAGPAPGGADEQLVIAHTASPAAISMSTPLVILVGRDKASILNAWRQDVRSQAVLFGLLAGVTILWLLLHQRRQHAITRLHLRHQAERQHDVDQAEQARVDALRVTQQFLDHLPGLAYVKDENLRVRMANRQFLPALGLDPEAMLGKTNRELFPGELGAKLDADDARVLRSGQGETIQEEFGGRHFESSKFVIAGEGGTRLLGGITLDVTRKRKYLERQEALLRIGEIGGTLPEKEFLEHGLEMIERLTASRIGFIHFVGDDPESIELAAATPGLSMDHAAASIWSSCSRTGEAAVFNDRPSGEAPWQRLIAVPIVEENRTRLILSVGDKASDYDEQDCTTARMIGNDLWRVVRRVRAECALKQKIEELTELNARLDETNNKLLQSEKMASIGQLAAGVAHEINNPIGYVSSNLNSLAGYVKDLLAIDAAYGEVEQRLGNTVQEPFAHVRRLKSESDHDFIVTDIEHLLGESREGLERVRKIVQDLKDFSRVGGTGWQRVNIHEGLESTLNIVWNEIKYKAEVDREYGDLPDICCIPSQINQVFLNLLTNAAQSIEAHGHIVLRSGCGEDSVWVEIRDDGAGIAPENLERIFEPFFTTKPVGQGTGLGLSLSWGIVQRHHGRIEVTSTPGQGTCFRITLPIEQPSEAENSVESDS